MSKVIKLTESDIKKIVKRVLKEEKLNEQPIDMACKSCIGKALGSKYSSKVEKAMVILMSGKTPTMGDLTELLSDVDIINATGAVIACVPSRIFLKVNTRRKFVLVIFNL